MNTVLRQIKPEDITRKVRSPHDEFRDRQSQELILGFAGAVGCGIKTVIDQTQDILTEQGYTCHRIKISDYIDACIKDGVIPIGEKTDEEKEDSKYFRYRSLQKGGAILRNNLEDYILAEYAITRIANIREEIDGSSGPEKTAASSRTAYLIDQLKHPAEVNFLRNLYGNAFYTIGVVSSQEIRAARLQSEEGVKAHNISRLIEIDRKESDDHGQQLEKTLHLADFFVSTHRPQREVIRTHLERFLRLIHSDNTTTPTRDEFGMYVAYSSGLRSACLSRQVGAALVDINGNIIATGRNDVPAPGGGLYTPEHGDNDARCANWGSATCRNSDKKESIKEQFQEIASEILREMKLPSSDQVDMFSPTETLPEKFASAMYKKTRVKDLIEFSRSIHAEMDAITTLARKGGVSSEGSWLYSTTFPCHNCARHIVAAGISRVVYIEPYEKSLALDLHGDAIMLNDVEPNKNNKIEKVQFSHFEGVAPRLYHDLFEAVSDRKDKNGKLIRLKIGSSKQKMPEYLDPYTSFESKVADHWRAVSMEIKEGKKTLTESKN